MNVSPKPSRRFAEYIRKIVCDEWESLGARKGGDSGVLRHTSGATVYYLTHDGGNDHNGPRNFATAVQRVCGCPLIVPRGRKRSRKQPNEPDAQVEAARRKHGIRYAAQQAAAQTGRAAVGLREWEAKLIDAADRRRREIEELMR